MSLGRAAPSSSFPLPSSPAQSPPPPSQSLPGPPLPLPTRPPVAGRPPQRMPPPLSPAASPILAPTALGAPALDRGASPPPWSRAPPGLPPWPPALPLSAPLLGLPLVVRVAAPLPGHHDGCRPLGRRGGCGQRARATGRRTSTRHVLDARTSTPIAGGRPSVAVRTWRGNADDVGGVLWAFGKPFRHANAWKNFLRATSKGGEEGTAT